MIEVLIFQWDVIGLKRFVFNLSVNKQFDFQMSLSKEEQQEFNRVRNSHNGVDDKTYDLCRHYYEQYKAKIGQINTEKIPIVMKTALYVAEKSQFLQTINGEKIFQPSMTLGHLLKTHQADEVMITLKHFTKDITIEDKEANREVANIIKDISFFINFYKKFEKVLRTLDLKQRYPQTGNGQYLKNLSSLTWLFYIQARNKIIHKSLDTIDNTCLLAHTVAFVLCCTWDYIVPKAILSADKRINEQSSLKEVMPVIRDKVLEMFLIKSLDIYAPLATRFEDFFDELTQRGIIKSSGKASDFLSPDYLPANYRKVDKLYEKNMGPSDLDERIFYKERMANLTPSKFTPFARQGYVNKRKGNDNTFQDRYASHRILNYDHIDKIDTNMKNFNDTINIVKLPKNVVISPSTTFKSKLLETPISTAMENYNYVQEKTRKARDLLQGEKRIYEASAFKHIQHFIELDRKNSDKKAKQVRENVTYSLFKVVLEEYLAKHPNEEHNEEIYLALMAVSVEIVFFVNNSTITSEDIEAEVKIRSIEMCKACDFFISFDRSMPVSMKTHLIDFDASYISYKLWRDSSNLQILRKISRGQKENISNGFGDRMAKKFIVLAANNIVQFGNHLGLDEALNQKVYTTIGMVLTEHIELLQNRHVDQLIMCSIFVWSKILNGQICHKFQQIINSYQEYSLYNKDIHDMIINRVVMDDGETHNNILDFYNKVYIREMKHDILVMKNMTHQDTKRPQNNPMHVPLNEALPRDFNNRKNMKKALKDNNTNLLISFTDSPLLKHEPLAFKGVQNPKVNKILNFEQEQNQQLDFERTLKEKKEHKQYEKLSPRAIPSSHAGHDHTKKGVSFRQSTNYPWKAPQQSQKHQTPLNHNGVSPTLGNKTVSAHNTFQLNQFTTNPVHQAASKMGLGQMGQKQQMAFGKGRHYQ